MAPKSIPVRSESTLECRNCGAGAPVDEHFCPQCSRILALGRHGDYFTFFGMPRRLTIDAADLERRLRELSRRFHPDFFYNAAPAERLASLERSSYLNDAYRVLKSVPARVEYLLSLEGLPAIDSTAGSKVPPALLEEVFALNEELDEIRELRESGAADAAALRSRLAAARGPIERKRDEHERQLAELSARWDAADGSPAVERRAILDALREQLLERNYIANLLATIERELSAIDGLMSADAASASGAASQP
jgi:molecular chaperone HscB